MAQGLSSKPHGMDIPPKSLQRLRYGGLEGVFVFSRPFVYLAVPLFLPSKSSPWLSNVFLRHILILRVDLRVLVEFDTNPHPATRVNRRPGTFSLVLLNFCQSHGALSPLAFTKKR